MNNKKITDRPNHSVSTEITDEDIRWFQERITRQKSSGFVKVCEMELKLAEAIKQLQKVGNKK